MDAFILLDLIDVKNKEALAYTGILRNKMDSGEISYEELQEAIDIVCDNLAEGFIEKFKKYLEKDDIRKDLKKQLRSIGADKKHSGKRVQEALYKKLDAFEKSLER
ncbi:MAG: hypothetical protein E7359_04235 [Clostridiales bacterium]|nr:hypothetical protein [Clostridiales bacterium]